MAHRAWPGEPIVVAFHPAIGWMDPIALGDYGELGTVLHDNEGSEDDITRSPVYFCGVENYTEGMVIVWSGSFLRTESFDPNPPAPFVTPLDGGFAVVDIGSDQPYPQAFPVGLYTLSATVDGVACPAIILSIDQQYYSVVAWGPA